MKSYVHDMNKGGLVLKLGRSHCSACPLDVHVAAGEMTMAFAWSHTPTAFMNQPSGGFTTTIHPHFLQRGTICEIVIGVSDTPRTENDTHTEYG